MEYVQEVRRGYVQTIISTADRWLSAEEIKFLVDPMMSRPYSATTYMADLRALKVPERYTEKHERGKPTGAPAVVFGREETREYDRAPMSVSACMGDIEHLRPDVVVTSRSPVEDYDSLLQLAREMLTTEGERKRFAYDLVVGT